MPKTKIDPRSERRKAQAAQFIAQPIARIVRPLKYISKKGSPWMSLAARDFAACGDGKGLQLFAQHIYSRY